MAEIRYVEGLLAFWDDLRRRFPHLILDIVQRRDLSTISRALDLSRADHEFLPHTDVVASQTALYGLSHWTPLSGTGVPYRPGQDYVTLSGLSPSFATSLFPSISDVPISVEQPANYPWDGLQRMLDIHRRARPFFRGDFYPLLEHIHSNQLWGAMQFHRADLGAGMVAVYRRQDCADTAQTLRLHGLDPVAMYEVTKCDVAGATRVSGKELMEKGLAIEIKDKPGAAVIVYRRCCSR